MKLYEIIRMNLRDVRKQSGVSQRKVSGLLALKGVASSQANLCHVEDRGTCFSADLLESLAEIYGCESSAELLMAYPPSLKPERMVVRQIEMERLEQTDKAGI